MIQKIFIRIILIPALLFLSACAGRTTLLSPDQRTFKRGIVLEIITKDGQSHHFMVKTTDDAGIHGSGDKYILFKDILRVEKRQGNPANLALAMLGIATIAGTALFIKFVRDPYGLNRLTGN